MDKRRERTLDKIRKSFEKLIIESNYDTVTVKEITAEAGINRKTFYIHFECIEDLFQDLEDRTENLLIGILEEKNFFDKDFSLKEFLNAFMQLISSNERLYEKLLTDDRYRFVFRTLKNKVKEKIISTFLKDKDAVETEIISEFIFAGLMKVFRVWRANPDGISEEKLYSVTYSVIKYGIADIKAN